MLKNGGKEGKVVSILSTQLWWLRLSAEGVPVAMAMEKPEAKVAFEADFIPLDSGSEDDLFCGVPDSEEYASPAFLAAYAAELRSLRASASSATPATPAETGSANSNIVVEDTSGFDCRIGERSNVQGVGVAHLNRLVKHRHKPASGDAASGAGDASAPDSLRFPAV